jgi:NADPH:quinone reductase-like Zn-dependent oxidoreductase
VTGPGMSTRRCQALEPRDERRLPAASFVHVEAAGVVSAVGDDVTSLAPGDQVLTHPLPLRHQGAWAEWLVAPAALVARKPAVSRGR